MDLEKEVKNYLNGDQTAFNRIYQETKPLVQFAIYSIVPNRQVVEDLIQDTYLKMTKAILEYSSHNFKSWLYTMAKNMALDYVRKKKEEHFDETYECQDSKKTNPYLDYAIRHLEEQEREIFLMKVLCGHTTKKISTILNLKPTVVNQLYYQAKEKLKKSLKEDEL